MNHHLNHHAPAPGPQCSSWRDLLPIVDDLPGEQAARLREHLHDCAYCRHTLESYRSLDQALRRQPGLIAAPYVSTEEIMRQLPDSSSQELPQPMPVMLRGATRARQIVAPALAAVAVIVVIVLVLVKLPGRASSTHPLTQQPTTTGASATIIQQQLGTVSFDSPTDGWAGGQNSTYTASWQQQSADPLLYHYDGSSWQDVTDRNQLPAGLIVEQIVMISPTDGWMAGGINDPSRETTTAALLHFDGSQWRSYPLPPQVDDIQSLQMLGSNDGWALATVANNSTTNPNQTELMHYDGTRWSLAPLTGFTQSEADVEIYLVMASPSEGWLIDNQSNPSGPTAGIIYHGVDGVWTPQATEPGVQINSLAMADPQHGWAVGFSQTPAAIAPTTVFYRYEGGHWTQAGTRSNDPYASNGALALSGPNDGWLIESENGGVFLGGYYLSNGSWTPATMPQTKYQELIDISQIQLLSATEGWAVGSTQSFSSQGPFPSSPLILHLHNGMWTIVQG